MDSNGRIANEKRLRRISGLGRPFEPSSLFLTAAKLALTLCRLRGYRRAMSRVIKVYKVSIDSCGRIAAEDND